MIERKPTPRDFPVLFTLAQTRRLNAPAGKYGTCRCCGLAVPHRNRPRHEKACRRRKRLAPEIWAEWREDMRR